MTITYRTAGPWGAGKGGNLTPAEVDVNFHALQQSIATAVDDLVPAEIESITLVGSQLTFVLADGRSLGPYTVPAARFNWRGVFVGATAYVANDIISAGDGIYLVLQNHTSVAPFDPLRTVSGQPAYALMFKEPRSNVYSITATEFTPSVDQLWGYFRFADFCDITIPNNSDQPFPIGAELHFRGTAVDPLYFLPAVGVSLFAPAGQLLRTDRVGATVTAKKFSENGWDLFGLLAPA